MAESTHIHSCCTDQSEQKHSHDHDHDHETNSGIKTYIPAIISFVLLGSGLLLDHFIENNFFKGYVRLAWYLAAYIPVGSSVLKESWETIKNKDFFNEFTLMLLATIGAFCIGEYPEGVAVMLFYSIGELFQDAAVNKAKNNIKALLDIRPQTASVKRDNKYITVSPEEVNAGETIQVKAGEKVPLDGQMLSPLSSFDTVALTGESVPRTISSGEEVLAGMVNLDKVIEIKVEKKYTDSSLAKILDLVQNATTRKAKTELFIKKFAKIYTPIIFFLALAITVIPYFIVKDYIFADWLYRGLIFLVISCPCALVISIPLGYFGGIGAASHNGILFKGANFLDIMTKVNTVVMDKTGTLTKGVFNVQSVVSTDNNPQKLLSYAKAIEGQSNHPIAKAILSYGNDDYKKLEVKDAEEIAGYGLSGVVAGSKVLAGNSRLMEKYNIGYDKNINNLIETTVIIAIDNQYAGYITIADEIKEDAHTAIDEMHKIGIKKTVMLSGDKTAITRAIANKLGVDEAYGDLLPEGKVEYIDKIMLNPENVIAFVGDGINDAPVLALSDVGIAMGGMGSDAAIEVADVIIQTDQPSKIATAIKIAKTTRQIVVQNIILAFSIKLLVLILGAGGLATMWEAVFADVGVALLAILNAVRIMKKKF